MVERVFEKYRKFVSDQHLVNLLAGSWVKLLDDQGRTLKGIRGRPGAVSIGLDGAEFGIDAIQMDQGTAFPLHTHPGDHILYVLTGSGFVFVDGVDHEVRAGDSIFIAGELPHGVRTAGYLDGRRNRGEPLVFLAFGHPHMPLSSSERMTVHPDNEDTYLTDK